MWPVIKQNHMLQWVPWLPRSCRVQNAAHWLGWNLQYHRLISNLGLSKRTKHCAMVLPWYSSMYAHYSCTSRPPIYWLAMHVLSDAWSSIRLSYGSWFHCDWLIRDQSVTRKYSFYSNIKSYWFKPKNIWCPFQWLQGLKRLDWNNITVLLYFYGEHKRLPTPTFQQ